MGKIISIFFCLIFLPSFVFAQKADNSYDLTGSVTDSLEHVVVGAVVTLLQADDKVIGNTLTDDKGRYEFLHLNAGHYRYLVSHANYQSDEGQVSLTADRKLQHVLRPLKNIVLDAVEVTADQSNVIKVTESGTVFHLSKHAREENSIYYALLEIPGLDIDLVNRKIYGVDGSSVIILINGVRRDTPMETIDPQRIEAVEIINNPPAKYLRQDGNVMVLNLKIKREYTTYRLINAYFAQDPELVVQRGGGGFETGNDKYSLYANASWLGYFDDDKQTEYSLNSGTLHKINEQKGAYDNRTYDFSIGGDYVITQKDYLSYSVSTNRPKENTETQGHGSITDTEAGEDYAVETRYNALSHIYAGKLYYSHEFKDESLLEQVLSYNQNSNHVNDITKERGLTYSYSNESKNYAKSKTGSYDIDYMKPLKGKQQFAVGSSTSFSDNRLYKNGIEQSFLYRCWNEYLYASYQGNARGKWSYMASAGLNLSFEKKGNIEDNYVRPRFSANLNYSLNRYNSLGLSGRGYTSMPPVSLLNPYSTSSDSMLITRGNPYLKPGYIWKAELNYRLMKNNWFLQSRFSYNLLTDIYEDVGKREGNAYVYTYENRGKEQFLNADLTLRYNIKNVGNLQANAFYRHAYYKTRHIGWAGFSFNWLLYYKSLTWFGNINHTPFKYTEFSKRKFYTNSNTGISWRIDNQWTVEGNLRYFINTAKMETWIEDHNRNFGYYFMQEFLPRNFQVELSVRYVWRNKVKKRQTKRLQPDKSNVNLRLLE